MGPLAHTLTEIVGRDLQLVAGETTAGSPPRRCPDMAQTIEVSGLEPAVSLQDGAQRTYDWYRDHIFEGAAHGPLSRTRVPRLLCPLIRCPAPARLRSTVGISP